MGRLVLVLVVGIGVGIGVGYLLGSGTASAWKPTPQNRSEDRVEVGTEAPHAMPSVGAATPTIETTPIPEGAAASLLKAVPRLVVVQGSGTVSGTVKTADGVGVAGVRVVAVPVALPPGVRTPSEDEASDEAYVARMATIRRWRSDSTLRGETQADGAWSIYGLGSGAYRVSGFAEGYEITGDHNALRAVAGAKVDFVAYALISVRIDVRYPDGRRPETASLLVASGSPSVGFMRTVAWNPASPELGLLIGKYEVTATVERPATASSPPATLDVTPEGVPSLDLVLAPSASIHGTVVWPADEDAQPAILALVKGSVDAPVIPAWVKSQRRTTVVIAAQKSFRFERLEPGLYTVLATHRDIEGGVARAEVTLRDSDVHVEVRMPPTDRALSLEIVVTDGGGKPVEGADFHVDYAHGAGRWVETATVLKASRGRYTLLPPLPDAIRSRRIEPKELTAWLTVRHRDCGSRTMPFRPGVDREIRVEFAGAAELQVKMPGLSGTAYASSVEAKLLPRVDSDTFPRRYVRVTREGDVFRFERSEAGSYELAVEVEEDRRGIPVHRQMLDLPPGTTTITVPVPRVHELRVRIPGARTGSRVDLTKRDDLGALESGSIRTTEVRAEGVAVFGTIPEGNYELRSGRETMEVTVPTAGEVVFVAVVYDAILVCVRDRNGVLAKAGFENGDLVLGIEGAEGERFELLWKRFWGALEVGDSGLVFLVRRNGGTVRLSLKAAQGEVATLGGEVEKAKR